MEHNCKNLGNYVSKDTYKDTDQLPLKIIHLNVDHDRGGKWVIHDTKHGKENYS